MSILPILWPALDPDRVRRAIEPKLLENIDRHSLSQLDQTEQ